MRMHTRREFFLRSVGPLVVGAATSSPEQLLSAQSRSSSHSYDLVVKGGHVVDPSQSLSARRDVAVSGSKIARLADSIPEADALHVIDAADRIVTPGWIDIHVHVYDGVAPLGIPADPNCIAKGVTTALAGKCWLRKLLRSAAVELSQRRRCSYHVDSVGSPSPADRALLAHNVAESIQHHVTLEVECIDRL